MPRYVLPALFFLLACELEQDIDLPLPDYEEQLVVECYLEPGGPYALLLSRSASFAAPFPNQNNQFLENILEDSAQVMILAGADTIVLENGLYFDSDRGQLYNYRAAHRQVPDSEGQVFQLDIRARDGQQVRGSTRMMPAIQQDSLVAEGLESDTLFRLLSYFSDAPDTQNFYRWLAHKNSLDSLPSTDIAIDDRMLVGERTVLASDYEFSRGDTVISTLYHIEEAYYRFLRSVRQAKQANGNPFAQPSPILSNVTGNRQPIGIFTTLRQDRMQLVIP